MAYTESIPSARIAGAIVAAGLLLSTLAAGIYGIGRSLWLDEAWVANSVNAPSLAGMFYYSDWLQTSPPLFLLLARGAVHAFGLSNISLRIVPLSLALLGVAGMLAAARRILSLPFAVLATALLAFHPTAIEYFRAFKQYSGEIAATTLILLATAHYLQEPARRKYYWLLGAVAVALPLSYPAAFLLPGVFLAVYASEAGRRARLSVLALVTGGTLGILYLVFIQPNFSPALREFWAVDADAGFTPIVTAAALICLGAGIRVLVSIRRTKPGWRELTQIVCLLPCALFAISAALGWYPSAPRTRLFVLPCFVLLLMMNIEDVCRRLLGYRRAVNAAVFLIAVAFASIGLGKPFREHRNVPDEDLAGAVRFLQKRVAPSDLLLVHPSTLEGFRLYAGMEGWKAPPVLYGDTGWPCCPRDKNASPGASTVQNVRKDLDAKIPPGFSGRVWLFYTTRPSHWNYVGLDEEKVWRIQLHQRGCLTGPYIEFPSVAITPMDCGGNRK